MLNDLIKIRKQLKLSRREIAQEIGTSYWTYERIEKQVKGADGKPYSLTIDQADRLYKLLINRGEAKGKNFQWLESIDIIKLLLG